MKLDNKIDRVFSLGRSLEWSNFSNRFALIFSAITFIVFALYTFIFVTQDYTSIENLIYPLEVSVLSFLAWAYAREFDPDDPMTAIFSQVTATIAAFWFFPDFGPVLLGSFLLLLMIRVINRSCGKKLVEGDYILLIIFGVLLTFMTGNWLYAIIVSFGFIINSFFDKDGLKSYLAASLTGAVSVYFIVTQNVVRQVQYFPVLFEYLIIALLVITIILRFVVRNDLKSKDDKGKELSQKRVLAGAALMVLGTVTLTIFGGEYGYMTASPGWAVIAIYPLVSLLNRE